MKNLLFVIISAVMVSGLLLGSIDSTVFATKDDNNGKAKGCDNANNNKIEEKNPHCMTVEECLPGDEVLWYQDHDGDNYGDSDKIFACPDGSNLPPPPTGVIQWTMLTGDCNDADPNIYPGNGCS